MKSSKKDPMFLLLNCSSHPIAHGLLMNPHAPPGEWKVQVLDGRLEAVLKFREIQLVSPSDYHTSYLVRITGSQEDVLTVEPLRPLAEEVRENLRVPVRFSSLIYPLTGAWKGRREIQSVDLSSGGISFRCEEPLSQGETLEVVIPISPEPLIRSGEVLRVHTSAPEGTVYAVQFNDQCYDADKLVREFVFSEQIRGHFS